MESGGTTTGTTVSDGGFEVILPGGAASGSVLTSGGYEYVYSGASASGTSVSSGAIQNDDGTTSGTQLAGFQIVYSGAAANSATITSEGYQYILPGGLAAGADVASGGIQNDDGAANNTVLAGFQAVFSGAVASITAIGSAGYQYILPGGVASGTDVVLGGIQNVEGSAGNNLLDGSQVIFSGAEAISTTIDATGYQYILRGGIANSTIVSNGGIQNDDGTANNTSLGGFQAVFSGATASNTIIENGGYQYILPGGGVSNTTLYGVQNDDGVANGNIISSGGYQIVFSGASASGTTIDAGGFEVVVSGGATSNATISGGYLELGGGNGAGGVVTFSGGDILKLDDSLHFNGKIAGFALPDQLDLADIAFGANTTLGFSEAGNNTSGTLTVSDGTHTANILLLGQYVAGNFHITSDGGGGTVVTDPPVAVASDQQGFLTTGRHA